MSSLRTTLLHLLEECKNMRELKQIHTHIIKSPFLLKQDQSFLITRLLFFCALSDSGSQTYATAVFRVIKNPTLYVYNIMIRAYACRKTSALDKPASFRSLVLYKQMVGNGIGPNCLTFPFLVKECAARSDGGAGRSVHGQVVKYGCEDNVFVRNSLMNMYSVCGSLSCARKVFDEMPERDVVSWNSMIKVCLRSGELDEAMGVFGKMKQRSIFSWNSVITGCVQGGRPKEALELFHEMQVAGGVRPDKITIASVLAACAHLGAVDHGTWVHGYLRRSGLESDVVIGTALVDMFGKCGCVEKAYEVFKEMPKSQSIFLWR